MSDISKEEIHELLEVIEEQLMAVPNRTQHIQDKLDVIADAKAVPNPVRHLRRLTSEDEPNVTAGRAKAARQILDSLNIQ